jgi:hypothetical protein
VALDRGRGVEDSWRFGGSESESDHCILQDCGPSVVPLLSRLVSRLCGHPRAGMRGQRKHIRQRPTGGACLGLRKAAQFHILLPSTTRIDRLCRCWATFAIA